MEDKPASDQVDAETYFRVWGEFPSNDKDLERRTKSVKPSPNSHTTEAVVAEAQIIREAVLAAIEPLLTNVSARLAALEAELKELNNRADPHGS